MPATRVYLVRHAKAEPQGGDDAARRLTPEGRARFDAHVKALAPRLRVARIVTSPFARARQTAELLAARTGATVETDDALASGASDGREVLALARKAADGTALVGHNPELAQAVATAAGKDVEVKPGAVAALDVDGGDVRLAWLEAP
ncbi:SixA phosphatase family protein [Anaeromyxobacter oryzae]|uniref:Phosphohistidine phosphatase n=1 Tax=Anaeromyxobacter oryzae TaxID=2918170 RepID=A0ABM7WWT4_9BACT|nr:histidine phosphatase family protein [Anaeromyxobacter oryzae]BDG03881.1 phosphohistidine phosphatase [Anaeromyxobacter oryzae]